VGGAMLFRLAGWWFDPCLIPFAGYLLIISNFEFLAKMEEGRIRTRSILL
jgi:hypothetical protein